MYVALISALSLLTHEAKCCVLNAFVEFCTVSLLQRKIHKWMHWYTVIHIHTQIHRKYPLQFPVVKGWKDFWLSQLTNSLVYVLTFTLMQFKDSNFFFYWHGFVYQLGFSAFLSIPSSSGNRHRSPLPVLLFLWSEMGSWIQDLI